MLFNYVWPVSQWYIIRHVYLFIDTQLNLRIDLKEAIYGQNRFMLYFWSDSQCNCCYSCPNGYIYLKSLTKFTSQYYTYIIWHRSIYMCIQLYFSDLGSNLINFLSEVHGVGIRSRKEFRRKFYVVVYYTTVCNSYVYMYLEWINSFQRL